MDGRMQITSPIAFDMGASHTGIFSFTENKERLRPEDRHFCTIVLPTDSNQVKYSMQTRTAKRHMVRGYKRFKLARRLTFSLVQAKMKAKGVSVDKSERVRLEQALSGLLKRRGYNRVQVEADTSALDRCNPQLFAKAFEQDFPGLFDEFTNLRLQWENISQDLSKVKRLQQILPNMGKNPFGKQDKATRQVCLEAFRALKAAANEVIALKAMGHKHRADYLKDVQREIHQDSRLAPAIKALGSEQKLANLVGNISNLQERAGRWYFDGEEKKGLYFDPSHLKNTLVRAFQFFHPESSRREAFSRLIQTLRSSEDIVETLCTLDPVETIAPYEDQNNRRPPQDLTLLLDPKALTRSYGERWKIWAQKLQQAEPFMGEGLDVVLGTNDRKTAKPVFRDGKWEVDPAYAPENKASAYVLQRFLDRNKLYDRYCLRLLCRNRDSSKARVPLLELTKALGVQHVPDFLKLCSRYYEETEQARSGLWQKDCEAVLERSDLHPSMIGKVLDQLLSGILGIEIGAVYFSERIWKEKLPVKGRPSLCGVCRKIEESRKNYGNGFKTALEEALNKKERGLELGSEEKDLVKLSALTEEAANFIGEAAGISQDKRGRFSNAFSLAQLYNLLEGDRHGFTSTCRAVHEENLWRMRTDLTEDGAGAICSRLPADCVRPFDGVLRRVLDRSAEEAAGFKADEIISSGLKDADIRVFCIAEQNRFAYSASLAEIKEQNAKIKAAKAAEEKAAGQWRDKWERIKEDSAGICPYTGEALGEHGEYDHIIPRAYSKNVAGTIFNSELNLIYCSQQGNQKKGKRIYRLGDLSPRYLEKQFGTSDAALIEKKIAEEINGIPQKKGRVFVDLLSASQRRALRHALFLEEGSPVWAAAVNLLNARISTVVNGTQGWFIKSFQKYLRKQLSAWCAQHNCTLSFYARQTSAKDASALRFSLEAVAPETKKGEFQSAASHGIDALCAYAVALADPKIGGVLESLQPEDLTDARALKMWLPASYPIVRVEPLPLYKKTKPSSRPLYKDTIYGEHFLPISVRDGKCWVGFEMPGKGGKISNRALEVSGKSKGELIRLLSPFFVNPAQEETRGGARTYRISKTKAFDFLWAVGRREASAEEQSQAALLKSLCYQTAKVNVESYLLEKSGAKLKSSAEWVINPDELLITIKSPSETKKLFKFAGKIEIPSAGDWKKLFASEELRSVKEPSELTDVLQKIFHGGSGRPHHAVRRVFSLPTIAKAASGDFRIRRKALDGSPVYQTQRVSTGYSSGLELTPERDINWKKPAVIKAYATRNLTSIDEKKRASEAGFVPANHWAVIARTPEATVELCPATSIRPYLRITQPQQQFFKSFEAATGLCVSSILQVPPDTKVDKNLAKNFRDTFPEEIGRLLSTPTNVLSIVKLGSEITYQFTTRDQYSARQKEAYQNALRQNVQEEP